MSAITVHYFNADDKQALIAYLRSQPAVDNPTPLPADQPSLLAAVMLGAGLIKFQPPVTVETVPKGATADYGKYIVSWRGCRACHGPELRCSAASLCLRPRGWVRGSRRPGLRCRAGLRCRCGCSAAGGRSPLWRARPSQAPTLSQPAMIV